VQTLISHFGGTPALIIKILFLGLINGAAIWAIPALLANGAYLMLGVLVLCTVGLDFFLLGRRFIPGKYVIIGAVLLLIFQIIPILYTVSIAFTNYSTGHIGTKEEAIATITTDSVAEADGAPLYEMLPLYTESEGLVVALTEIPAEPFVDEMIPADGSDTGDVQTEFGGDAEVQTEFGGDEPEVFEFDGTSDEPASGDAAAATDTATDTDDDMNLAVTEPEGGWPPTYIGTDQGLDPVNPGDVQRSEFGTVTGITGYATVPEADYPDLDEQLSALKIPGPTGGFIVAQGFTSAIELTPIVTYDAVTDTFTNVETGVVYVDNGEGSFVNPDNPDDELLPGWKATVGWSNFARIVSDPDVTGPFSYVFAWTFAYAILTVILTFAVGLTLAIALNRPGMRGQRIYRSFLIIPYAVPAFLSVLVWAGLLNDDFGAINSVTGLNIPWLFDPFWAKVSALLVNLWLGVPYMFLVSTGALQAIPSELQEAARIDGARNFQVFRLVNLPLLLVALTPLLVAAFAFNFNNFNNIYLLTGGGPALEGSSVAGATDILISYTYKIAFAAGKGNDFGLASAISIIIFLIVGSISAISFARSKALREERS